MEITKLRSITDKLSKYTFYDDDNAYIQITEWGSGEGWDIIISDKYDGTRQFQLSWEILDAINYLVKYMQYEDKRNS